jgi:acyl carrier protein
MSEAENAIFEKLQDIVAKQLSIDPSEIQPESSFTSDLNADSLDVVELVMTFEEEFDVPIEDEVAGEMSTVQDAIAYIARAQKS